VAGVGTGGTITGLAHFFARVSPRTEIVLADPAGSIVAEYVRTGQVAGAAGSWLVEGIGEDFIPPICDLARVKQAYTITDAETFRTCRELLGVHASSPARRRAPSSLRRCAIVAAKPSPSEW